MDTIQSSIVEMKSVEKYVFNANEKRKEKQTSKQNQSEI